MESLQQNVQQLNEMILQGNIIEAMEKFYDDEVVMQENAMPPTIGKEANLQREKEFISNLIDFRGARPLSVAFGENLAMTKWHFDYTHKEWGDRNYTQVSVQNWKNGKIVREEFFYGN